MLVVWVRACIVKMAAGLKEGNFYSKNVMGLCNWTVLFYGLLWFKIHNRTEQISGKQYRLHKIVTKHHHFEVMHAFPLIYMAIIVKVFKRRTL